MIYEAPCWPDRFHRHPSVGGAPRGATLGRAPLRGVAPWGLGRRMNHDSTHDRAEPAGLVSAGSADRRSHPGGCLREGGEGSSGKSGRRGGWSGGGDNGGGESGEGAGF